MTASGAELTLLAWGLTFALHGTAILGAAFLIVGRLGDEAHRAKERVWKLALIGPLVTASLQVGLGLQPLSGSLPLGGPGETALVAPAPELAGAPEESAAPVCAGGCPCGAGCAAAGTPAAPHPDAVASSEEEAPAAGIASLGGAARWGRWLLAAWMLAALAGLFSLGRARLSLTHGLAGRRVIRSGELRGALDRLMARAGVGTPVALTVSPSIGAPISLGVRRREICLPERALEELGPQERECILAHELAHVARRDPTWLLACRVLEALFPFQPLIRLARRRLFESIEYLCDDWAVERTGRALPLARCLADVADWVIDRRQVLAAGMVTRRSRLARRIERLLHERTAVEPHRAWAPWCAAAALPAVLFVAPAASSRAAEPAGPIEAAAVAAVGAPEARAAEEGASSLTELLVFLLGEEMDLVLAELDREIELVETENTELRLELGLQENGSGAAETLLRLERGIRAVRDRRDRIADLLAVLRRGAQTMLEASQAE